MSLSTVHFCTDSTRYRLITDWTSPEFGKRDTAIAETYKTLLYRYMFHPEAKSLGPDGKPCGRETRGLLQRTHVIAGKHRRIGKEADRRWEEGDDLELVGQSMGFGHEDRYKHLKITQDADAIMADCGDLIVQHGLDPVVARNVVINGMIGDQPLPLRRGSRPAG